MNDMPGIPRTAPIIKQVRDSLLACPFCGSHASLDLHSNRPGVATHFTIGCHDDECAGSSGMAALPIMQLQSHQSSWNSRSDQASIETAKHFEKFVGFAATCRRENTYDWMCLMLDWLNGAAARLKPGTYFDFNGDSFVSEHD